MNENQMGRGRPNVNRGNKKVGGPAACGATRSSLLARSKENGRGRGGSEEQFI